MSKGMSFALALAVVLTPVLGSAQDKPGDGEHHGPRPEAVAACKDKSDGDACEFDAPRGHVVGTCHTAHTGDLACFHPHHHHHEQGSN